MKVKELIESIDVLKFIDAMERLYYDKPEEQIPPMTKKSVENTLAGYVSVLDELKGIEPVHADISVSVKYVPESTWEFDGESFVDEPFWSISGHKPGDPQSWAIEFNPWEEWLGMEIIAPETPMSNEELAAHIVWEMTFCGFTNDDVKAKNKEIFDAVEECKSEIGEDF